MSLYMINYDLNVRKDYQKLYAAIESMTTQYVRPLKSMWIIKHNGSAFDIASVLCKYIDSDDKLIVNKLTGDSSWTQNFGQDTTNWIHQNL
ncbi:hypothetical protein [Acinetobacter soli]|uniref:hypothetical protein n=2 Tax=Acinetobacter TaxID=469 RepID=UPI000B4C3C86|nr:hypothetical protein [Acinetobacter soli]